MGEINQDKIDRSLLSAKDRALLSEANHVLRKIDSLLVEMQAFFEEGRDKDEVSKIG